MRMLRLQDGTIRRQKLIDRSRIEAVELDADMCKIKIHLATGKVLEMRGPNLEATVALFNEIESELETSR